MFCEDLGEVFISGAFYGDRAVDASEEMIRLELDIKSVAVREVAACGAGFEPEADVVVGDALVFDDGDGDAVVTHPVCFIEEQGAVAGRHDDPEIVLVSGGVGEAILHGVEGSTIGALCGEEGGGICRVAGADVKADDGTGTLAGDAAGEAPVGTGCHVGTLEITVVHGVEKGERTDTIGVVGDDADASGLAGVRDDGAVFDRGEGGACVRKGDGVYRARCAPDIGCLEDRRLR